MSSGQSEGDAGVTDRADHARPWRRWLPLALAVLLHAGLGYGLFVLTIVAALGTGERLEAGERFEFVDSLFWFAIVLWAAALVGLVFLWRRSPWLSLLAPPVWLVVGWVVIFYGALRVEPPPPGPPACDLGSRLSVGEPGGGGGTAVGTDGAAPTVRWCDDPGDDGVVASNVLLTGERVLFGSGGGIEALALGDGRRLWRAPRASPTGAMAIGGEILVAGEEDGLLALDLASGEVRWRVALEGAVALPPLIVDGAAVAAEAGGTLNAVELASGEIRWRFATGHEQIVTAPLAAQELVLVVGQSMGRPAGDLIAVEVATGAERWRAPVGYHGQRTVAVDGDVVYAILADPSRPESPTLAAIEVATGRVRWRSRAAAATDLITSGPAVDGGFAVVGIGRRAANRSAWAGGGLLAVDAQTGDRRWQVEVWAPVEVAPTFAGGVVYALDRASGGLWAVDGGSGGVRWHRPYASGSGLRHSDAPVRVEGDTVYVRDGEVLDAVDAGTGVRRWRFKSEAARTGEFAIAPGLVVVGGGGVYVLAVPDQAVIDRA